MQLLSFRKYLYLITFERSNSLRIIRYINFIIYKIYCQNLLSKILIDSGRNLLSYLIAYIILINKGIAVKLSLEKICICLYNFIINNLYFNF